MKSEAFSYTLRQMFNALSLLLVVSSGYKSHSTCPVYSPAIKSLFLPKSCFCNILMTVPYKFRGLTLFGSLLAIFFHFHATLIASWKKYDDSKIIIHVSLWKWVTIYKSNLYSPYAQLQYYLSYNFRDWKMINFAFWRLENDEQLLWTRNPRTGRALRSYPTPLLSLGGCRIKPAKTGCAKML